MKMMSWTKQWALAAIVMCGCQLGVEQLEVGDEADETDGSDAVDEHEEGDGDGDGEASLACVLEGTNILGGTDPQPSLATGCEVECATGWGHDAPPLAIAWTLELEHQGPTTGFTHLEMLPSGDVLVLIGWFDAPARLVWLSPAGELLHELSQPAIDNDVWEVGVDSNGIIYAIWRDGDMHSVTALSSTGEHQWTVPLGPHEASYSVLAPLSSGVVVLLNSANRFEASELVRISAGGGITPLGEVPNARKIAVSPSGDTIALTSDTSIAWYDLDSFPHFPHPTTVQGVADVAAPMGLVALDDERVASVGVARNWDEGGSLHGYVKQIGSMGLEWESRYDRMAWSCEQPGGQGTTEEHFIDVDRLSDGSLIVVGRESTGFPTDAGLEMQPFVVHTSVEGEVLGTDRGFWRGEAIQTVGANDGSAYVLLYKFDDSNQQHLHVRKYTP
jgi:hypothetical protein